MKQVSLFNKNIPLYLKPYIAQQDPNLYTPIDHAVWRYILKISHEFFKKNAHQKYLAGLEETGITLEHIPLIEEMNHKLKKYDWQAVPVSGFIPPSVFKEFLSLGILPVACDMRKLENLAYTPAPDIVHEAAGHAPILTDPEFSHYLRSYGEISRKAIYSQKDLAVYEAIRALSTIKESPEANPQDIIKAENNLNETLIQQDFESEATLLARMGWWTFEYGLLGSLENPKIYGAGLLSSVAESYNCFKSDVKKLPFSISCTEVKYDITHPQPQLFVAESFKTLEQGLEDLASTMAFKKGGLEGLEKAKKAETVNTVELETGIQVSGVLADILFDSSKRPIYLKFKGPVQLSYKDQEIPFQGVTYHSSGFGTPLIKITPQMVEEFLNTGKLKPIPEITIEGKLINFLEMNGEVILISFEECTVRFKNSSGNEEILFQPDWGTYDMICGEKIVSVFGGAADREKYLSATGGFHQDPCQQKTNLTPENQALNHLYARVRKVRESGKAHEASVTEMTEIYKELKKIAPEDWLLFYELLEWSRKHHSILFFEPKLLEIIQKRALEDEKMKETIERGLSCIDQ